MISKVRNRQAQDSRMTRGEMVWNVTAVVGNSIAQCQVKDGGLKETIIEIMFSLRHVNPTLRIAKMEANVQISGRV